MNIREDCVQYKKYQKAINTQLSLFAERLSLTWGAIEEKYGNTSDFYYSGQWVAPADGETLSNFNVMGMGIVATWLYNDPYEDYDTETTLNIPYWLLEYNEEELVDFLSEEYLKSFEDYKSEELNRIKATAEYYGYSLVKADEDDSENAHVKPIKVCVVGRGTVVADAAAISSSKAFITLAERAKTLVK